jgi:hypothetical protein
MADDNFRSYRSRDPLPRDEADHFASDEGDPLAELARLIGQSDPNSERRRTVSYSSARSDDRGSASDADWAAQDDYADEHHRAADRYVPPPPPAPGPFYAPKEPAYEDETPSAGRYFSGPAAQFNGFREESDTGYREQQVPVLRARDLPAYATAETDESYEPEEPEHDGGEGYAADEYYDEAPNPRRRSGVLVFMAVLGLAVVGSAGAFGYRTMFGGSVLPTLPPIIKAGNGPIRIVPNYGETQSNNSNQSASATSSENLVSREEQPVNIEPPKPPPRVVATIPVSPAQNAAGPSGVAGPPGAFASAPNAAPGASPWPPAPPPMPTTTLPAPAPSQAQAATEPKRIHTVTIRPDQAAPVDVGNPAASPQPAARNVTRPAQATTPKPAAAASPPAAGSNAPLSIVPGGQTDTRGQAQAPARSRTAVTPAATPMSVASAGPVTGVAAPAPGGRYAVQITSQRSEAEAQASFRELRAKFPNQLNGREPMIRRADLGDKGTYYRALVGPFASMEEAAGLCSGLKAAGGNCIVQKN